MLQADQLPSHLEAVNQLRESKGWREIIAPMLADLELTQLGNMRAALKKNETHLANQASGAMEAMELILRLPDHVFEELKKAKEQRSKAAGE